MISQMTINKMRGQSWSKARMTDGVGGLFMREGGVAVALEAQRRSGNVEVSDWSLIITSKLFIT